MKVDDVFDDGDRSTGADLSHCTYIHPGVRLLDALQRQALVASDLQMTFAAEVKVAPRHVRPRDRLRAEVCLELERLVVAGSARDHDFVESSQIVCMDNTARERGRV